MKINITPPAGRWRNRVAALLSFGLLFTLLPARSWAQCNQLVWGDEFNTAALDTTKWKVVVGDGCPTLCGFGNAELQNYRAQNLAVTGGNLIINTKLETTTAPSGNTYQYSSGKIESKVAGLGKLQTFKYGRIEARMQLPSAGGIWPAFWMLADPSNWPYTGEIDIMEAKHKNPNSVTGTAIGDAGGGNPYFASRTYSAGVDLSTGFHVYALEWGPDVLRFYVDGNLYNTVTPQTAAGAFPFNDNQFYLILNAAVGGPGSGYTGYIQPTPGDYPTQTLVDYVRIYKGTYNYAVLGDGAVYQNEQYKNYRIDAIAGATYAWSVPAGATIVSGQGTNSISVNYGTSAGNVAVTVTTSGCTTNTYSKAVTMSPALNLEKVYEDFQSNRFLIYGTRTGVLTQAVANPASAAPNTSTAVGKYVRNASETYDVLYVQGLTVGNANDFAQGRKKVYVDVYSTAPVGSRVTMQFENGAVTTSTNFPMGRHSAYKAFTTKQNAWETLEFDYEKTIDAGTNIFAINNVAFLFEPGLNSANTFYFDNVRVYAQPAPPVVATDVLENYDGTSRISYDAAITNGTYTANFANPSATGVNTSAKVAKYVRNSTQTYDVLFFNAGPPGTVITDAGKFKGQTYQLQLDLYTDAPVGTTVRITLQNKTAAAPTGSYPAGRNSTYLAVTTAQNAWQTLTLSFDTAPDAGTSNLAIDQLAVLFNGNTNTGNTYYLDNIKVIKHVADPTYTAGTLFEDYETVHNVSYVTANGTYLATQNNPAAAGINTSAHVAKYTRNSTQTYDALTLATAAVKDGALYKSGDKVFAMDVYTAAPVGTVISWQLESSVASQPSNYPAGRHSIYQAVVKQSNAWQTLQFTYASTPDGSTTEASVDRLVFLFAPNSSTGDVYYFDNLRSLSKTGTAPTNVAPTVSLTSPTNGATYTTPASISLTANAADSDGTVSKVEFFNGATLLGTSTASPYSYTWTGVAAGTYSLTAKATDNSGAATTSAAVSVTVNAAPTAQAIPGKIEAESFTAQSGTQTETTTDTGGGLNVDYFETGDWLDYSVNVATAGSYTVGFRVASANGGATLQLRNSGGTVLGSINVGNTGGWQSWQTINATVTLPAGVQTLRLYASASTGCNVNYLTFTAPSNVAPTVSLTSPTNGTTSTAPASITISANAADSDGTVSKVDFYNGTTLLNSDTSSPYSYIWTGVAAGTYSITAKATDNAGAVTTSAAVSITVNAAPAGQAIPGTIEAESYSAMLGIQTETTTDTGGGLNVGYIDAGDYLDYAVNVATAGTYTVGFRVASATGGGQLELRNSAGTALGSVAVGNTGGWQTWTTVNTTVTLAAGAQTLRVYAPTAGSNLNWLSFTAAGNTPPTVSLTSPSNGTSFTAPASITISANAADANGTVSSVAFYNGTTLLNTDTSAPYSYTWTGVASGTYSLTAKATDNAGAVTTSTAVSVTVSAAPAGTYCATTTDFSYGAVSSGGNVTFTFHPLGATAGGTLAILYLRNGTTGTYPGYTMTKNGAGDFTYTLALASGTLTNLYFTYQVGAGGPERNNSATPFTYTAGQSCNVARALAATPAAGVVAGAVYPNPVSSQLTVELRGSAAHTLTLRDLRGALVREIKVEAGRASTSIDLSKLAGGVYLLTIRSADGTKVRKIMKE
ncbi:carbohydrate-binding protein [Hymenobacter sp. DH14]|uniref:Carbohydrate-binding protein n=1 Tax=Hymenobacter cyanobacteriorum TaxID=2926463 RepID=A0A9X1VDI4_9BACT|nr:carbohydrate-binding protein [Hymenobacter cyanobacteriorum]MCI1187159.1 carbohydrate-binding protein [Hymenobacter cyanobacteriorum]